MNSERTRLGIGLLVSFAFNATLIVPGLAGDADADALHPNDQQAVQPPEFNPPPEQDTIKLGIEESEASTLTWIGYEQYREHMARLSELEQAQFIAGGGAAGGGGDPTPPNEPSLEPTPSEPQPPQPTPEPLPEQPSLPEVPDSALPTPSETQQEGTAAKPAQDAADTTARDESQQPATSPPAPTGGDNAPQPGPRTPKVGPSGSGAEDLPPVPNASDRDSDAAAIVPVNVKRPGGPVAAQGLQVRTFRPILTPLDEMQFGRISIVVKLAFDRRGKPRRVFIGTPDPKRKTMRWKPATSMSGYLGKVITSLYRWRASGKDLQDLEQGETLPIVFELTFK